VGRHRFDKQVYQAFLALGANEILDLSWIGIKIEKYGLTAFVGGIDTRSTNRVEAKRAGDAPTVGAGPRQERAPLSVPEVLRFDQTVVSPQILGI